MVPTDDDWFESVRTQKIFKSQSGQSARQSGPKMAAVARVETPTSAPAAPSRLGGPPPLNLNEDGEVVEAPRSSSRGGGSSGGKSWGGGTYRTVCVRLCDGFYVPISFSTTRDKLERDADRCEATCGGQARMFYYQNPGSEVEDMEDMDGKPYKKLPTAFRFRTSYNAQCTCRPHPWQHEALERHKLYALQEKGTKGDKDARKQADELDQRLKKADASAAQERAAAAKALDILKAVDIKASKSKKPEKNAAANGKVPAGKELIGVGMTLPPSTDPKDMPPMSRARDRAARSIAPKFDGQSGRLLQVRPVVPRPAPVEPIQAKGEPARVRAADAGALAIPGQPLTLVRN